MNSVVISVGRRAAVLPALILALVFSGLAPLERAEAHGHGPICTPIPPHATCGVGTGSGRPKPKPGKPNTGLPTNPGTGTPGAGTGGPSSGLGPGAGNMTYSTTNYYWFPAQRGSVPSSLGTDGTYLPGSVTASFASTACAGGRTTQWGPYVGVSTYQQGTWRDDLQNSGQPWRTQTVSTYDCKSPAKYNDSPVTCAYSAGARAVGPYGNPSVPSRTLLDSGPILTAFVKGGSKSLSLCTQGFQQSFNVSSSDYGRYQISANGRATACVYRDYYAPNERTGVQPPDQIVGCSGQFPFAVGSARWQQFCPNPGWTLDWSGSHSFTNAECLTSSSPTWTCGPQIRQYGTYAGLPATGAVNVIDDGKNRKVQWNTPVLTGIKNAREKGMRLDYQSGTPFRLGVGPGSSLQPFTAKPAADSWGTGWYGTTTSKGKSAWDLNFQAAGLPGKPWTARPNWKFKGEFTVKQVTVKAIDWRTGQMTTSVSNVQKTMSATCTGQPVSINAYRARISN